jgi:hypothetical protein
MVEVSLDRANHYVLQKQHLTPDSKINDIVQIVTDIGGLHASSAVGPYLSLFARTERFEKADLSKELSHRKSLARVRYVRNTVYILPKDFIPLAFAATSRMAGAMSERHYKYFGFTPRDYDRISGKILNILKGRGLSTKEIKGKLRTSRNIAPLVNLMCDRGLLVRGLPKQGWKSILHTYFRFEDYYPDLNLMDISEEAAREAVIKQYLASFGPVTEGDITWWTGFPIKQVRKALKKFEREITSVKISGLNGCFFLLSSEQEPLRSLEFPRIPVVNLLPYLDPYLMGYKHRKRCLDPQQSKIIFDSSGNASSSVLVDGQIVGVWDFDEFWIKVYLFKELGEKIIDAVYSRASEIGAFIADRIVPVKRCDSVVPLDHRAQGSFMSPLKNC